MKKAFFILSIIVFVSCKINESESKKSTEKNIADNIELATIYRNDQADRQSSNIDWDILYKKDSLRQVRVYQLLDSNKVKTSNDYHNAAMIFQHGGDSIAYGMAVKLMRKSIDLDSTANKWLLAAAIDRHLLSTGKPQIYGTQYTKIGDDPWKIAKIDTTQISDNERIRYGVETLAQQREKVKQMNKTQLISLISQGKSIEFVIKLIKSENNNEYDVSENGINNLGYDLMELNRTKDALKVFVLNTELFPKEFNTWDSLGECLMELGEKKKSIQAYKKSLELNPNNTNAKKIIEINK